MSSESRGSAGDARAARERAEVARDVSDLPRPTEDGETVTARQLGWLMRAAEFRAGDATFGPQRPPGEQGPGRWHRVPETGPTEADVARLREAAEWYEAAADHAEAMLE